MDTQCFVDAGIEIGEGFDGGVGDDEWVVVGGGGSFIEFCTELRVDAWCSCNPIKKSAAGVRCGVAAGDELGEGFGCEF